MKGRLEKLTPQSYTLSSVAIEHYHFSEGDKPKVLTAISIQCSENDCGNCPGIFYLPEQTEEPIFCVHKCHLKPSEA